MSTFVETPSCARVTKFKINWDGSEGAAENSENVPPKRDPNQLSDNSQVGRVETLFFLTLISSVDGHSPEINQWPASSSSLHGDRMKHFHDLIKKSNSTKVCSWKTNTSTS